MKHIERGVVGESYIEFTISSDFARSALYCCPQVGHFYCDSNYNIERDYYDWFLMCYVCDGTMKVQTKGQTYTANAGEVVLLDCHVPHRYYCPDHMEFIWFHFFGNSSEAYTTYLTSRNSIVFSGESVQRMRPAFSSIMRQAGSAFVNEHLLSREIGNLLCSLATSLKSASLLTSPITPALTYVARHFSEQITLDDMADQCMISRPHLIRCFHRELNCTPHDYLLDYRLRESKQMLSSSSSSIEEIAEQCGFNSVSHFSRAFRKRTGMTPSDFRNMW